MNEPNSEAEPTQAEPTAQDFEQEDPAAMRAVAEQIAFRNRRRILLGIVLVVAFCITLSYLGPNKAKTDSGPATGETEAVNIP